jgi:hypothetical protein
VSTISKTQISKSSRLLEEVATLSSENDEVRLEGGLGAVFVHIHVEAYILTLVIQVSWKPFPFLLGPWRHSPINA